MNTLTMSSIEGTAPTPGLSDPSIIEMVQFSPPTRLLLSVREAAAWLGIGRTLMYELLGSGAVESLHVGRLHKVPFDALTDFVARQRGRAAIGHEASV